MAGSGSVGGGEIRGLGVRWTRVEGLGFWFVCLLHLMQEPLQDGWVTGAYAYSTGIKRTLGTREETQRVIVR